MNRTILVGRLTKDPDLRFTPNGVAVATFTLAVNRTYGEKEADFISIVVWRKQAENVANYLKKSSLAGVDGRIQTRNYEGQDGKRVYVTEVIAEYVQFLEPKNSQPEQRQQPFNNEYAHVEAGNKDMKKGDPFSNAGKSININDDDLPF